MTRTLPDGIDGAKRLDVGLLACTASGYAHFHGPYYDNEITKQTMKEIYTMRQIFEAKEHQMVRRRYCIASHTLR